MKPHPYILERALESTGVSAADCLMIGDSPDDFLAAKQAGVTFLGFITMGQKGKKGDQEAQLRDAGARYVVGSLEPLYSAALGA
jgi:phosphoglycolate phosphatase-like HAD superfamily hydrolase